MGSLFNLVVMSTM